jgi:hypothetical protein
MEVMPLAGAVEFEQEMWDRVADAFEVSGMTRLFLREYTVS